MDGTVAEFAKTVSIETCRIVNTPNVILLCGGSTGRDPEPIKSARDYFYRYLNRNHRDIAGRVKLAETINDWFDHDTFSDLLELEEYLADLSDLVILFVESPGSIAELGAFAASSSLRPKTLAVLNTAYPQARTFIADGPVRRLRTEDQDLVWYYDWNASDLNDSATQETFENLSIDLSERLIQREHDAPKERQLTKTHAHAMLLVADLVEIVGIVTGEDISDCLSEWGYLNDRKHLQKYVSLLRYLKILDPLRYSSQTYYVSAARSAFIRYDFKPGTLNRDRERIKSLTRSAIGARNDTRAKAFRSHARKLAKGGIHV